MGTSTAPDQNYGRNPALPGPTSETPKPKPTDPSNLGLSAVLRKDGNYNITARWNPSPDAAQYALYTSKNNDAYAWNSVVQGGETTVQYSRVSPGSFGVRVASRTDNGESAGVEKVITLPATGIGLLGIAAVAGLGAGRRLQRKKKEMV